ncbi:ABC transporter ATP-binding protein [Lacipirellula parvula]|uniref:Lipid A export permease/ATP-binding protein MsbA n=1 Tax=Lacipirellula parvula TaxID=2650471 RepID=A0A5K7XA34_9BACT|nr:ABC transporter ATP-binding protein [Lacipirellula parvula]BBO33574.1 lipid A export permease/ATP-binding protein MsbA [Lacipirellula parvula]
MPSPPSHDSASDSPPPNTATSRTRFDHYRELVRTKQLPKGGGPHGEGRNREEKGRVRSARQLAWAFIRLLRPFRLQVFWILASATIATLIGLLPPAGTKFIIDYGLSGRTLPEPWRSRFPQLADPHRLLLATVVAVVIVSLVKIVIYLWGRWYATKISKQIQLNVRQRVFEHAVRLPLHRVQQIRSGGVASILREDGGAVGELMFGMIFNPWRAVIQLVGSLAILAWVDWKLLTGAVILLPVVFFTHRAWISNIRPQFRVIRKQREQIDAGAAESFAGMRVVRAFSRQRRETARFVTDNNLMARQELYAWWWMRGIEMVWEALIPIASAALLFYGGWQVLAGQITVGDLMMFLVYLLMLLEPLATLVSSATQFQNSLSGLDRVLDLLDEAREMPASPNSIKVDHRAIAGAIEFDNVTFAYPGGEAPALSDVNLKVQAGQTVALVGPSGAGKTTLSNLVARFYDPTAGRVLLDGRDLRDYDVESFRAILGIVEQDVFLFDGTIAANISYSRRDATEGEIRAAAETANAAEFIDRLPDGLQTVIGERGVRLSGGQRQRLAIARAVLADPKLLILDEATSNLDTDSEQLIQQSLATLMQGRTSFVIAHRLSTIAGADLIVVVEGGRISQTGTHAELMAQGGKYRSMVEQQIHMTLGSMAPGG